MDNGNLPPDTIVIWQIIHKLQKHIRFLSAVVARQERQIADLGVRIAALEARILGLEDGVTDVQLDSNGDWQERTRN